MPLARGASIEPPACLPPRPARAPARFLPPRRAWDTHAHLIGGGPDAPFVSNRGYTPPCAGVDAYVAMLDVVGIDFGVVIQVSVHGNDNRLIADALRRYPHRLRGVVSIDGTEQDETLADLRELGVCGIRLNEHFEGGSGADRLQQLAARCRPFGWHVDLGLSGARLRELAPQIRKLEIPFVIDHMGVCPPELGVGHEDFAAVVELARLDHGWVKLSGGYRISNRPGSCDDMAPFVRALCDAAPARTIWAADWPNVAIFEPDRLPETGAQLDALHRQIGDMDQLQAVLVDNPARLYARPDPSVGGDWT